MKRLVLGVAGAFAISIAHDAALAADLIKARPGPKSDPCAAARFSGGYFGGNAGAVAYTALRTDADEFFPVNTDYSANKIGVSAGMQAGYDWQSCNKVFGIVADLNWADTDVTTRITPNLTTVTRAIDSKMDWFSTLRARAGLAVNDTLFYVTGGVAAAKIKSTITHIDPGSLINEQYSFSDTRLGLVGGFGTEFVLRDNWSVNAEVLHMQFEKKSDTFRSPILGNSTFVHNDSVWVGRVGLNYRFGDPRNAFAAANAGGAPPSNPCGPSRFTGGYVGGNAGAVSYSALRQDRDGTLETLGDLSATKAGFTAGAQLGWDWQSCNTLLGIVADWNWSGVDATARLEPNSPAVDQSAKGNLHWFSTLRARAGLVVDDTLIYVTGGVAAARIETTITNREPGLNAQNSFGDTRWGLAAGIGAEFALSGNWSLNSELLYLQFAKDTDTFRRGNNNFNFESQDSAWISRVGLNYRWDTARDAHASASRAAQTCGPARFGGGYVGGSAGVVGRTTLNRNQDNYIGTSNQFTGSATGVTAGVQGGYDWQSCHRVFGVVADMSFANADTLTQVYPNGHPAEGSVRRDMDWFGTLRTRAGLVVDDALVYVTGGLAIADMDTKIFSRADRNRQTSFSDTRWGWTGGAGAEFALAGGWSVNGEVLYMQFAKETNTIRPIGATRLRSFEHYDSAWIGRVGVNYRWGRAD